MKQTALVVLLSAMTYSASGQVTSHSAPILAWKPPRLWMSDALPKATVSKEMTGTLRVSGMTIVLEKTDMRDVQRRFGGAFGQEGDAGDYLQWLCVRGGDATGPWVLWLESGEMNAGTVGSFQWRRLTRAVKFDERCGSVSQNDDAVELPIALGLGISESKVLRTVGQPTARQRNTLLYVHEREESDQSQAFTVLNTLSVVVTNGRVSAIEVLKVSSD